MTARGYASQADVLVRAPSLSAMQAELLDPLLEAAEDAVDLVTGRVWLSQITNEVHPRGGPILRLRQWPIVVDDTHPLVLEQWTGAAYTALDPTEYVVDDAALGKVRFPAAWDGISSWDAVRGSPLVGWPWGVRASYTVGPPPSLVRQAVILTTLAWLRPYTATNTGGGGAEMNPAIVSSYSIAGALSVTFRDTYLTGGVALPTEALALLANLQRLVFA